ncbi:MAG TPA: amidohydrolase family protein [Candidatus Elarobacter sp.]
MLHGVRVVDVERATTTPLVDILCDGDRIVRVGRDLRAGEARVIAGRGAYAAPGLWDMHVHLSDMTAADVEQRVVPALLASGVLGVRDMGGDHLVLSRVVKDLRARGHGPAIVMAGPFVDGPKPGAGGRITVRDPRDAERAVLEVQGRGAHFVKTHNALSKDAFIAVVAAAHRLRLPVAVHLALSVTATDAANAGIASFEHTETLMQSMLLEQGLQAPTPTQIIAALRAFASGGASPVFARFAASGVRYVPTLVEYRAFVDENSAAALADGRQAGTPPSLRVFWDRNFPLAPVSDQRRTTRREALGFFQQLVAMASSAGVRMMAGTDLGVRDVFPGASLHDELRLLAASGMSTRDVLRAAMIEPVHFLGLQSRAGAIRAGMAADAVLTADNPLDDLETLRKPLAVITRGTFYGIRRNGTIGTALDPNVTSL